MVYKELTTLKGKVKTGFNKMEIGRPPFKFIYKLMSKDVNWDTNRQTFEDLWYATCRIIRAYASHLPHDEARYWLDDKNQFRLSMIENNPLMLEKLDGITPDEFIDRGDYIDEELSKSGVIIMNSTGTKIVVRRCHRSGKYTLPKKRVRHGATSAQVARQIFEEATQLCSCRHLEYRKPYKRIARNTDIYFACGVPDDTPLSQTVFFDAYKFVDVNAISRYGGYAAVVTKSLYHIKKQRNRTVSPTKLCDCCVTSQKVDDYQKFDELANNHVKVVLISSKLDGIWLIQSQEGSYGFVKGEAPEPSYKTEDFVEKLTKEQTGISDFKVDLSNVVFKEGYYKMYYVTVGQEIKVEKLKFFKFDGINNDGSHENCDVCFEVMVHLERVKKYCGEREVENKITDSSQLDATTDDDYFGAIILDSTFTKFLLTRGGEEKFSFPKTKPNNLETPKETVKRAALTCTGHSFPIHQVSDHTPIDTHIGEIPHHLYFVTGADVSIALNPATGGAAEWFEIDRILQMNSPEFACLVKSCLQQIQMFCNEEKMANISVVD